MLADIGFFDGLVLFILFTGMSLHIIGKRLLQWNPEVNETLKDGAAKLVKRFLK